MFKTYLVFLFLSFSFFLYAQQPITGIVVDASDGAPLFGAQVISESSEGTVTDKNGNFSLNATEGEHTLTIMYLGYEPQTLVVTPQNRALGNIPMQLSSTTLNEVVLSTSVRNYKNTFKGSNFRLTPENLKNTNPLSTEEVLATIPGVNIVGDMGLSNRPNISIRGSWGRRSKKVLLMEDGSPSAPAPYIAPGSYYNPVSDRISAIEVYKGADMLRYGPNNMYGAVNYITALPPQKPELRVKLVGGERNYKTGLLSYGGTWNNLGALIEGVYKKFDGFTNNSSIEVLNLNAKIFSKLSENQSLYFKVSGQFEDNQASLSAQTPFTFETDPEQNPLDADQFTMRRYGVDIIHKWLPMENLSLTSKIYASDFERDWWRQVTTKIIASEVENYVGEAIFNDRYSYLRGQEFNDEDYVIVGRINDDGNESTTDSRWFFGVYGVQETASLDYGLWNTNQNLEVGLKYHGETFKDRFLEAPNSRWARFGETTTDTQYRLWSFSGYARNEFNYKNWGFTPIVRFEHIHMYRQDLIALAQDPTLQDIDEGKETNEYTVFLPGVTVDYSFEKSELYASLYRGFIAPSKVFGFLVEQDGVVTNPLAGQSINIAPELSWNREIGWRGTLLENTLSGQLTYFNNSIENFYAGGRNEVFVELGKMNVQGIEAAFTSTLYKDAEQSMHLFGNATFLHSKLQEGVLEDRDLFSQVIHSNATVTEYVAMVNNNRDAYRIFVNDGNGGEVLYTNETLSAADFPNITKSQIVFGEDGVDDTEAPYTPAINLTAGLQYDWHHFSIGVSGHYAGEQYTEFHNFNSESADGAIGKLPSYFTMDAFVNYEMELLNTATCRFFVNGKNITNNIYRSSRLNRATSGIFPGGFRQIIAGVNVAL